MITHRKSVVSTEQEAEADWKAHRDQMKAYTEAYKLRHEESNCE